MITDKELQTHFGTASSYFHAINLRDRLPENANLRQASLEWANREIAKTKAVIETLEKNKGSEIGKGYARHFRRAVEILEALAK